MPLPMMSCVERVIVGSQKVLGLADMMASESLENKATSSRSNAFFFTKSKVHRQFEAVCSTVLHSKNDALSTCIKYLQQKSEKLLGVTRRK